jgi:hypothetical protein
MLTPLGSYRHRGNVWFDGDQWVFSQAAVSHSQPCEPGLQRLDQMLLGHDLAAAVGEPW